MGERGRTPKPRALVDLANNPGHRSTASLENEPSPELKIPPCPAMLKGESRQMWEKITAQLYDNGLISELDENALVNYCIAWRYRNTVFDFLENYKTKLEDGTEVQGLSGYLEGKNSQTTPHLKLLTWAMETMDKIGKEFGLTPSARSRMKVLKPVETEPGGIDDFIGD